MKEEAYYRAKRVARSKKKLRLHVISTIGIIIVLAIINAMTGGRPWIQWPVMGMGIGLIFHALKVYGKIHSEDYEAKVLKKELEKYNAEEYLELKDNEGLELDELPELREEWKDSDFV